MAKKILKGVLVLMLLITVLGCNTPAKAKTPGQAELLYARETLHNNFSTTPLDQKFIDLIVRAAFTAPTGGGQRSVEFFVVTDREVMKSIQRGHPYSSGLDTAPLVVVVAANETLARYPELHEMDSGLAAMAMIVQATDLGLASCVLSISPQEERVQSAANALSMPDIYTPVLMVAFGYPAADARTGASVDYKESQVHTNAY
ncbi:MAG: nitroreductase family protein [Spirochaetaceae bacterium]|jgi:nitroreductase|nr:nitroreductase family protein [Spirochaetaceae bacterium]